MVFKNLIMKKFLYILIFIPFLTFSQGINLELNQVLLLDVYADGAATTTYVVPEGKVWKVTSVQHNLPLTVNSSIGLYINDVYIYFGYTDDGGQKPNYTNSSLPMWLPEGTTVEQTNSSIKFLSILEFNTQ